MVVLVSALLGAVVAVAATVAIERLGGRLGGVVGAMPTTIVPASLGLWAAASGPAFDQAMGTIPVGLLVDALFLATWRYLPAHLHPTWSSRARLAVMVVGSLAVWGVGAGVGLRVLSTAAVRAQPLAAGMVGLGGLAVAGGLLVAVAPAPSGAGRRVLPTTLVLRGLLAALAVGAAVALGAWGVPVLAGLAAVFPAIFLTTMVSLWVSQGEEVPVGAVGSIVLGSCSVGVFALVSAWTFPWQGPWVGAALSWAVAVLSVSLPLALWLRR